MLYKKCEHCGGDGIRSLPGIGDITCAVCSGTGFIEVSQINLDDMIDKLNDIMDKCNDIFEKVNE